MKKFVSIALALVLTLSLTVVAFAAITADDITGATTAEVAIAHTELAYIDAYAAEIVWAVNGVAYGEGSTTWDTTDMKWGAVAGAAWSDSDAGSVTVNNFSSQDITVSVTDDSDYLTVTGGTTVAKATAPSGEAVKGTAGTATWTIAASGTPEAASDATITVAIS